MEQESESCATRGGDVSQRILRALDRCRVMRFGEECNAYAQRTCLFLPAVAGVEMLLLENVRNLVDEC